MKRGVARFYLCLGGEQRTEAEKAFLDEIEAVCRKHGLSIGHEDCHGAFEIGPFDEDDIKWLRNATTYRTTEAA